MKTFLNAIGFFLGMIGLIALGWSMYLIFFVTPTQQLLEVLPAKNFSFIAVSHTSHSYKMPIVGLEVPPNGALVSYTIEGEPLTVSIHSVEEGYPASCEEEKGFVFCLERGSKTNFYSLLDKIEQKLPPLSKHDIFLDSELSLSSEYISYVGIHDFLLQILDGKMFPILSEEHLQKILILYAAMDKFFPYFSGEIIPKEKEDIYRFVLYKSEEKNLFPSSISEYSFLPQFFPQQTAQYLYIKQPSFLWKQLKTVFSEKQWIGAIEVQTWGKENLKRLFKDQINIEDDIFPLLHNDMVLAEDWKGEAVVLFSLPSKELAEDFSLQFSNILERISAQKTPIKKGHELNDGTFLYEIFPDTTQVTQKKTEKGDDFIVWYENKNSSLNKIFAPGLVQKDSFLMMATDKSFLSQFWEPRHEFTNFVLPSNETIIFSYGLQGTEDDGLPFSFLEMAGDETLQELSLVVKVKQ